MREIGSHLFLRQSISRLTFDIVILFNNQLSSMIKYIFIIMDEGSKSLKCTVFRVSPKLTDLFFQLDDFFSQGVVLLCVGHVLLAGVDQLPVLFDEKIIMLFQHLDLLLVIVLHLHAHVLAAIQNVLVFTVHLHLDLIVVQSSLQFLAFLESFLKL